MERNRYFDFIRGLAIMLVIGIHTFKTCNFDSTMHVAQIAVRQMLNCAVPLFLALSAFFLGGKDLFTVAKCKNFWKKQIPKVYIPVLIWSLPLWGWDLYKGEPIGTSLFMFVICGYSIYYFVALIIQLYLLLPILQKIKSGLLITISSIISLASIIIWKHIGVSGAPLIAFAGPFYLWILFFSLGIVLSRSERNYSLILCSLLAVFGLMLQVVETYYSITPNGSGFGIKPSTFVYSTFVIMFLFSKKVENTFKQNKLTKIICVIGDYSFGIYLIHCFLLPITSIICDHWGGQFIITLAISMAIVYCGHKILPKKIAYLLGF